MVFAFRTLQRNLLFEFCNWKIINHISTRNKINFHLRISLIRYLLIPKRTFASTISISTLPLRSTAEPTDKQMLPFL